MNPSPAPHPERLIERLETLLGELRRLDRRWRKRLADDGLSEARLLVMRDALAAWDGSPARSHARQPAGAPRAVDRRPG